MDWYYVRDGEKVGPISDVEFQAVVAKGSVIDDTLVWNKTMKEWTRYAEISSTLGASLAMTADVNGRSCSMCGKEFADDELIQFEGSQVCANCKPNFVQQIRENSEISGATIMRYAGFWRRAGAFIIDYIAIYVAWIPLMIIVGLLSALTGDPNGTGPGAAFWVGMGLVYIIQFSIPVLYVSLMHGKYGATLGKKLFGMRVVMSDGAPITYGRATGRCFAAWLNFMTIYIGFIIAGFDSEKRGLHDHICNTRVVRTR